MAAVSPAPGDAGAAGPQANAVTARAINPTAMFNTSRRNYSRHWGNYVNVVTDWPPDMHRYSGWITSQFTAFGEWCSSSNTKTPAASDGAGHAEGTELPLSPMAEHRSPSDAPSVFSAPGPFLLARAVYGRTPCQIRQYRLRASNWRVNTSYYPTVNVGIQTVGPLRNMKQPYARHLQPPLYPSRPRS